MEKKEEFIDIVLPAEIGMDDTALKEYLLTSAKMTPGQYYKIERRSIDARQRTIKINLRLSIHDQFPSLEYFEYNEPKNIPSNASEVIIIGAGPAGLFAAIEALEHGIRPIILERGKDVRSRRWDLAAITKNNEVNPESNYCFGEGGAGTYSDGKLYTRSTKRGSVRKIFEILVAHGASEEILFESHPHIGTNKLPKIITALRETITSCGGQIHFESKVTDFLLKNQEIQGVKTLNGESFGGIGVILATGHSARDIYYLCQKKGISIEAKPFAVGVRIEHPQALIDQSQYHCLARPNYLPASAYSLVTQIKLKGVERGVFSFCMCPGGYIVPAATSPGEIVVNGMSPSRRNSKYANSGLVVAVELNDINVDPIKNPLGALAFQTSIEQKAWEFANKTQAAPAQRVTDFLENILSQSLPESSYQPGLTSSQLSDVLPDFITLRLKMALKDFDKKIKGYVTSEGICVGVESRTSSPVRIPRNTETLEHVQIKRLYPCGEGAGYAGGIVSAAIDGMKCMNALAKAYS